MTPRTCEDRDYRCCDLTPPVVVIGGEVFTDLTEAEYDAWYDDHVMRFLEAKAEAHNAEDRAAGSGS